MHPLLLPRHDATENLRTPALGAAAPRRFLRGLSRRRHQTLAASVVLAIAPGCHTEAASDLRDFPDLPQLTVDEQPVLVLADDGTEEKLFSRITARRLASSEIAVADQGTSTIHVFDRGGRLQRTLARYGRGPGELKGGFLLAAFGDTLFTFGQPPMSSPDVNVFAATTGFVSRSRPETDSVRVLTVRDRLATGQLLVTRGLDVKVLDRAPALGSLVPDTVVYGLYSAPAGEARGRIVWLPAVVRQWLYAYRWRGSHIGAALGPFELAPRTLVVASGDRVWLVEGGSGELRAFDGAGRERAAGRLTLKPRSLDQTLLERRRTQALAAARRQLDSARIEAMYDPGVRPTLMPLAGAAYAGPDGELWVRIFSLDETAPQQFVVVGREGAEIGRASLPAGLDVQQVGRDFVLAVQHDSLGVPSVVEYQLHRP